MILHGSAPPTQNAAADESAAGSNGSGAATAVSTVNRSGEGGNSSAGFDWSDLDAGGFDRRFDRSGLTRP